MARDWRRVLVAEIASTDRNALVGGPFGSNLVSRDYVDDGIPVIRGQNMRGRWVGGKFAYVTPAKARTLSANLARPGDIVFTQRGTLGQVAVVPEEPHPRYLISQSQMKLSVNREVADPLYLYYVFRSEEQQEYIRQRSIQTGVPHTNLGILRATPVLLPPIDEQRAIVGMLGALDDKIDLNRRMSETLEAIARALFKSWFVDFNPVRAKAARRNTGLPAILADLFPETFEDSALGEIPKGWAVKTIGDLANVRGGGTPNTAEPRYWRDGRNFWATPKDFSKLSVPVLLDTERSITDAGLSRISSGLLPRGTVLLSSRAPIGYLAIAEVPVAINQGFIALTPSGDVSNIFLLLWATVASDEILSRANGSTFLEISKTNFRPIPVVMPSATVMHAFDQFARPLYERIVACTRESRVLELQGAALLPKLISGEIRIATSGKAT
jgi:type I restriction enzyme S subunit